MAENLKSAIETRQDQDSSGHRRMCLTIKIVMRIGATPGCSGCAGSGSHTEAYRVRSGKTLADEPAHSPTIPPMTERLGSTVLFGPVPPSKDETTTGSLYVIDGIDVMTALVQEEDVWGTHLCNLCLDTRWLAHVLRDRPDDSHGLGGLLQMGGPVADALWF